MSDMLPATYADLTPKMRDFLHNFVELGGRDASRAAALAGYSTKANGHRVIAHRLLKDPRILAALRYELETKVKAGAALAMSTLLELAEKASTDGVRFQAAQAVLDRAGMLIAKTPSEHHHFIQDNRTVAELVAFIRDRAATHGLNANELLGDAAQVVDAEFDEVPAGRDGLEDILP